MITVQLNDETISLIDGTSLADLIKQQAYTAGCFSLALNGEFKPRHEYDEVLQNNDRIDVIRAMQGG